MTAEHMGICRWKEYNANPVIRITIGTTAEVTTRCSAKTRLTQLARRE